MSNMNNELSAYIALLVQHAGGRVAIPFNAVEKGLPADKTVKLSVDEKLEQVVFELVDASDVDE